MIAFIHLSGQQILTTPTVRSCLWGAVICAGELCESKMLRNKNDPLSFIYPSTHSFTQQPLRQFHFSVEVPAHSLMWWVGRGAGGRKWELPGYVWVTEACLLMWSKEAQAKPSKKRVRFIHFFLCSLINSLIPKSLLKTYCALQIGWGVKIDLIPSSWSVQSG